MADIKQAAKWLDEGKRIMRKSTMDTGSYFFRHSDSGFIHYFSAPLMRRLDDAMETQDLLADDWEIAH